MRGANYLRHLWGERKQAAGHWLALTIILLVLGAILTGIIWPAVSYESTHFFDPFFQVTVDNRPGLDLDESLAIARRLDLLMDRIEAEDPGWMPPASPEAFYAWQVELAPMYQYEGASPIVNYVLIGWPLPDSGHRHNHVGGSSNCDRNFVLNPRFLNPLSHWYDLNWLGVLAHELAHNHQGPAVCFGMDRPLTEATAQLMSWEVLAALANKGNKLALYTLIRELRSDFLNTALANALVTRQLPKFERALREIQGNDPLKWASYQKMLRYWSNNMDDLQEILDRYSAMPINKIAFYRRDGQIKNLALATEDRTLVIDDLLYVLAHAEELVTAACLDNATR